MVPEQPRPPWGAANADGAFRVLDSTNLENYYLFIKSIAVDVNENTPENPLNTSKPIFESI